MININYDFNYELHFVDVIYLFGEIFTGIEGLDSAIFNGDSFFYT